MAYTYLNCTNDHWESRMNYSPKQQYTKYPYYLVPGRISVEAGDAISQISLSIYPLSSKNNKILALAVFQLTYSQPW